MCRRYILLVSLYILTQRACTADELEKNFTNSQTSVTDDEKGGQNVKDSANEFMDVQENKTENSITRILDNLLDGYDRNLRPGIKGPHILILVDIFGLSIGPIIEVDMEFKIDVFFRQRWTDNRLRFNVTENDIKTKNDTFELRLNTVMLDSIWYPDTYFLNGKSSKRHIVTTPNALFRISPDGSVLYTQRLTIVGECLMQLHKYPMDTQVCPLEIGSNSYSTDDIMYRWKEPVEADSIEIAEGAKMAQYTLERKYQARHYIKHNERIGNRSVLVVNFTFVRHVGFFLIQTYIPCVLIVILSWVSFFLNREATPARVALGIMAILTITTMGWSSRSVLPKVSYAKAVDWFNVLCFAFVFAALVEFAAVNYFTKRRAGSLPGMEDNEDEDDMAQAESNSPCSRRQTTFRGSSNRSPPESDHDSDEFVYQPVIRSEKVDAALRRKKRFTLLSSITRYNIKVKNKDYDRPSLCSDFLSCLSGDQAYREKRMRRSRNNDKAFNSVSRIDEISRILFPVSFIVINALFWIAYSF